MAVNEYSRALVNPNEKMTRPHSHETYELYYLLKGSTTYYIGDEIFHVEEGNFAFIPKYVFHMTDYERNSHTERIVLTFDDDIFTSVPQTIREDLCCRKITCIPNNKRSHLEILLYEIEAEFKRNDDYTDFMIHLLIPKLLVQLCRYKGDYNPVLSDTDQIMHQISKYISTHFQEPLCLGNLSKRFCISKSHLSRKFKKYAGIGINEYITYTRITNAERLLRENTLSIAQIAEQCGFSDSN